MILVWIVEMISALCGCLVVRFIREKIEWANYKYQHGMELNRPTLITVKHETTEEKD